MEYVTLEALKSRVNTALGDPALGRLISQESAFITLYLGTEPGSPVTQLFVHPNDGVNIAYRPDNGVTVTDMDTNETINPDTYFLDGRVIYRRGRWKWPSHMQASYYIQNRDGILAMCEGVCIDLCRMVMEDRGLLQSESIGGYSYSVKDTKVERNKIISRLGAIRGIRPVVAK